jgi:hypothetical protein
MPTFVFSYRNPTGYVSTAETRAAWMAWFDAMGDQLVDLGKPVSDTASVGDCTREATELGGYSLVVADDLEGALAIAKGCPYLGRGGGVEVGQLAEVPDPHSAALA